MKLSIVTAPTSEIVSLAEARAQCRISDSESDALLTALILAAREWAQSYTGTLIPTQTWEAAFDSFPSSDDPIQIPVWPVQSISSVVYRDSNGASQTLSSSLYQSDLRSKPVRIRPLSGWPSTDDGYNAVVVTFVAGFSASHPDLHRIRTAMLLHIEAHFDRDVAAMPSLIEAAENLLWPLRHWLGADK